MPRPCPPRTAGRGPWIALAVGLGIVLATSRAAAATVTVNTIADQLSACATTGIGSCSLRDAITFANRNPGVDYIEVYIPSVGSSPAVIRPVAPLPPVTDTAHISGFGLQLDGSQAGPGADGLQIEADGSSVQDVRIYGFSGNGIAIRGGGHNSISRCVLGLNAAQQPMPGTGLAGVLIVDSPGNSIGVSREFGIAIAGFQDGIRVEGQYSDGNRLLGNLIGLDYSLGPIIGTARYGIAVLGGRGTVILGGFIAGSGSTGVLIGPGSAGTVVQGVVIARCFSFSSEGDGILIDGSASNLIGGDNYVSTACQITANQGYGVHLVHQASQNVVVGNYINTNNRGGIGIEDSSGNAIGGDTVPGRIAGNAIHQNAGPGIVVRGESKRNPILKNSIFDDGGVGIDLGGDGVTANGLQTFGHGPNNGQKYPMLMSATRNRGTVIRGVVPAAPGASLRVEFFGNSRCHGTTFGEGKTYLGLANVKADLNGIAEFNALVEPTSADVPFVTATATDDDGNTSEFSQCIAVTDGSPLGGVGRPRPRVVAPRHR